MMAGARLLGSNWVCGIMIAGTIGTGVRLAHSSPLRFERVLNALQPLAAALAALLFLGGNVSTFLSTVGTSI